MHTYKTIEGRTVMSTKCKTSPCFCDARASHRDGRCDSSCTTENPCNDTQSHCISTFPESRKSCKRQGCPCESRRFEYCCNTCATGTKCVEAYHSAREYGVTIFEGPANTNLIPSGEQTRERGVAFRNKVKQKGGDHTISDAATCQAGAEEGVMPTAIEAILNLATICTHTHCNEQRHHGDSGQVCADCYGLTSEFCSSQGGHCQPYRQTPKTHDKTRCEDPEEDDDHDKRHGSR